MWAAARVVGIGTAGCISVARNTLAAFICPSVAVGVIATHAAGVALRRRNGAGASPEASRGTYGAAFTDLLACVAFPNPVAPWVGAAGLDFSDGARTRGVSRIVGQAITIVVLRRCAISSASKGGPFTAPECSIAAGADTRLADPLVRIGTAWLSSTFDARATAVRHPVAIAVVSHDTAGVGGAWADCSLACAPITRQVIRCERASLLPRLALPLAIKARVLTTTSRPANRAATHVVDGVISLSIAIVIVYRTTVAVSWQNGAETFPPHSVAACASAEPANAFCASRSTGFGTPVCAW